MLFQVIICLKFNTKIFFLLLLCFYSKKIPILFVVSVFKLSLQKFSFNYKSFSKLSITVILLSLPTYTSYSASAFAGADMSSALTH